MSKQIPIHGLYDVPINVCEMTIREHNKMFHRHSHYSIDGHYSFEYILQDFENRFADFKKNFVHIKETIFDENDIFIRPTIEDAVTRQRFSLISSIERCLEFNYKGSYPLGFALLYFFNDRGAKKYPTKDEWYKKQNFLKELAEHFKTDEKAIEWIIKNCENTDKEEHLDTKISIPLPHLQKDSKVYAVYISNIEEMEREGSSLFHLDTYTVKQLNIGRYGRKDIEIEDNQYHASLEADESVSDHRRFILNVDCLYHEGKMRWVHSNSFLKVFLEKEDAEKYIENMKKETL